MSKYLPRRSREEWRWLTDFLGIVTHGINQAGRMDALAAHVEKCEGCKKKLVEIIEHTRQEGWQI